MDVKRPKPERINVRRTVVKLALHKLLIELSQLYNQAILEQQVYVSSRISPESFPSSGSDGGILLRFVRANEFSEWKLDEQRFQILEDV